jgi:hypothetical protein
LKNYAIILFATIVCGVLARLIEEAGGVSAVETWCAAIFIGVMLKDIDA